jgi:hypothetical protein
LKIQEFYKIGKIKEFYKIGKIKEFYWKGQKFCGKKW